MDLALEKSTHDLVISAGDATLVEGGNWVQQSIKQNLLTMLGEWFLDRTIGLPWFDELLAKGTEPNRIRQLLIREIVGTKGVERLSRLTLDVDASTRRATVDFEAMAQGQVITGTEVFG